MPIRFTALLSILCALPFASADDLTSPQVLTEGWQIESIATEPALVTPVGCVFDHQGRLLVIESHTHFPPDDYQGPKADHIYRFDDSDGDGVLDRQQLFYEGGNATMGLAILPDDGIAVATRSEVYVLRDRGQGALAERGKTLLKLETDANYPHNGLGGLAIGPDGKLYAGQGENLGESYRLIGSDGSTQAGGGEGGNIFRVNLDGSQLERVATGFWNPFSLRFDSAGRLWTVGNDPDSMPPCRLLHVVEGGDYGFQFRFGRAGTHPLQAWDGEFPGTLPMAAGTGEAPCAVIEHQGSLWVSSWGSNRIERYRLKRDGATLVGEMEIAVQGGPQFRPVGMAVAKDGSIYITDWVDRSYPVHGKGRLWRISPTRADQDGDHHSPLDSLSDSELRAGRLMRAASMTAQQRWVALNDDDPWVRHAAAIGLAASQLPDVKSGPTDSSRQRMGRLLAYRWRELCDPESISKQQRLTLLRSALADHSAEVVLTAIRWATEQGDRELSGLIAKRLEAPDLNSQVFAATIAAMAYLETGSAARGQRDPAREGLLNRIAADADRPTAVRSLALAMISKDAQRPTTEQLREWIAAEPERRFGGEVIRLLAERGTPDALQLIASIAADESADAQVRADAVAALSRNAGQYSEILNQLSRPSQPDVIRQEARRVLRRVRTQGQTEYPPPDAIDTWKQAIGESGDAQAGRRVFFRTTCANCHAHSGRGSSVGPELTTISGHMNRERLIESILLPSREVGPLFVSWNVLTVDGQVLTGMKLDREGAGGSFRLLGAEGNVFEVPLSEIETAMPVAPSIMPTGLEQTMSIEEFADLIAFLEDPNW